MSRWEYALVKRTKDGRAIDRTTIQLPRTELTEAGDGQLDTALRVLNTLGEQGWEIAGIESWPGTSWFWLKRVAD